jgi:hypothetical protein
MKFFCKIIIYLLSTSCISAQETENIIVTMMFSNNKSSSNYQSITEGQLLPNKSVQWFDYQQLSVYNVILEKGMNVTKNKNGRREWFILLPPSSNVTVKVECRCLNKGHKIPLKEDICASDYHYTNESINISQEATWNPKKYWANNCSTFVISKTFEEAVKEAIKKLCKEKNIYISSVIFKNINITDCGNMQYFNNIELQDDFGRSLKLVNIRFKDCDNSNNQVSFSILADIYIEPQYAKSFGEPIK